MFQDGEVQQYAANTIDENIYYQVYEYGYGYQLMDHIINHKLDGREFPKSEEFTVSRNVKRSCKQTNKGWYLLVQWKDCTNSWVPLREMK